MDRFVHNKKIAKVLTDVLAVLTGAFLSSFALFSFINPNGFVGGGIGGIATILEAAGIMKSYIVLLVLNVPLLVFALLRLKKSFAVKTVCVTLLTSGIMAVMDKYKFFVFTDDRLLAAIYAGLLYGLATGILYESNSSTGGTEIIARLVAKKHPTANFSMMVFLMDVITIIAGLTIFDIWSVAYAIVCSFCFERTLSFYLDKGKIRGAYFIITEKPDAVGEKLREVFGGEGLSITAFGGYTGCNKTLLKAYLPSGNVNKFKALVKDADDKAFSYTSTAVASGEGLHNETQI